MSASLRSPKLVGAREPVSGSGQVAVSERHPAAHRRRGRRDLNAPSEPAERAALRGEGRSGRAAGQPLRSRAWLRATVKLGWALMALAGTWGSLRWRYGRSS